MERKYTNEELTARRLAGVLPHIDVDGRDFIVDWRLRELRAVDDPSNRIGLGGLPHDSDGEHYLCFYNTKLRQTIIPDIRMTELPKDVVVLTIPSELTLDPVAVAREYGQADTFLIDRYPIRDDLKVKVTPIAETEMVQLVSRNREKHRLLQRNQTVNRKRSKGKGL